jgi:transposase
LVQRNEPGRRAKFVKKSQEKGRLYSFDDALQTKIEKLLGVKGYVTNIPEEVLSNIEIISYYRDLWHVEQAFRMSKSDLCARPIFHRKEESIRAHILICFIALMIGKYLEIKTELSLKKVRDALWKIHEAHVMNELSGEVHILNMDLDQKANKVLTKILENTH